MYRSVWWIVLTLLVVTLAGCPRKSNAPSHQKPLVVATTTMIAEMARLIGGNAVRVHSIMRVAEDPHTHQPTSKDALYFQRANLILVNGLHLEGKMLDMINNAGKKAVKVAEQSGIKTRKSGAAADPHVWWNAEFFAQMTQKASDAMLVLFKDKPAVQKDIRARTKAYIQRLRDVHKAIKVLFASIPNDRRWMITSHDAFFYFGDAYGIKVDAVGGISTEARVRAAEALRLAKLVSSKKIRAIFSETSVSQSLNDILASVMRLAKEKYQYKVLLRGPLYSDSLGEKNTPAGSYIGAIKANATIVYESLTGKKAPASFVASGKNVSAPTSRKAVSNTTQNAVKRLPTNRRIPHRAKPAAARTSGKKEK